MRRGHSLQAIGDYTIGQFSRFLEAARQLEAAERSEFVTDMTAVVGSLFGSGKGESPVATHMDSLRDVAAGVTYGR